MLAFWENLPIRSKLLAGVGIIVMMFAVALSIDFAILARQAATVERSATRLWPVFNAARDVRRDVYKADDVGAYVFIDDDRKDQLAARTAFEQSIGAVRREYDAVRLSSGILTQADRQAATQFGKWLDTYYAGNERAMDLWFAGKTGEARTMFETFDTRPGEKLMATIKDDVTAQYEAANAEMVHGSQMAETVTVVAGAAATGLGIFVAFLLGGAISKRLGTVASAMDEVVQNEVGALIASMELLASGDLTARVESHGSRLSVAGTDESARLATSYNQLLEGIQRVGVQFTATTELLARLVGKIKGTAEAVGGASREIADGNTNLSQRTEEQASGLEETASSMEEFTATVKQNSESAQEANTVGTRAQSHARRSGAMMHDVVSTMNTINGSSQKIVEIISVIDGIAFQTNILALNAAVEAARAGEQGRGFAVVAGEVRSLAQRSSSAAKEIKELIEDTVAKVAEGSSLVEQAGSTMDELVDSVQQVTTILGDIAAASREQSGGIDQVNKAIAQMDEVTQQNAALVEQAAAAAASLQEQAQTLVQAVGEFKLAGAELAAPQPLPLKAVFAERVGGLTVSVRE